MHVQKGMCRNNVIAVQSVLPTYRKRNFEQIIAQNGMCRLCRLHMSAMMNLQAQLLSTPVSDTAIQISWSAFQAAALLSNQNLKQCCTLCMLSEPTLIRTGR